MNKEIAIILLTCVKWMIIMKIFHNKIINRINLINLAIKTYVKKNTVIKIMMII